MRDISEAEGKLLHRRLKTLSEESDSLSYRGGYYSRQHPSCHPPHHLPIQTLEEVGERDSASAAAERTLMWLLVRRQTA